MYSIEGGLDFYSMIYKTRDETDINIDNKCLITNDELTSNSIILECNHKFNYMPLFKDVYTRIYMSHNSKYSNNCKVKLSPLICPYCRHEQCQLLPFIPEECDMKIFGINTNDESYNIYEPCIPLYMLKKCLIQDCGMCCYSGSKVPFCIKHFMDKNLVKKYRNNCGAKNKYVDIINQPHKNVTSECTYILQRGKRKGEKCGIRYNGNDGLCKRHKGISIK
jgi:hypothetical protein